MSPVPFLIAAVIIGYNGYEEHLHQPHAPIARLFPSSLALLLAALGFSLLMGWAGRRRKARRDRRTTMRSRGGSAAYPYR